MDRPIDLALLSLDGLSLGDCFGEQFFGPNDDIIPCIIDRIVPTPPWPYTDDTEMALSLVEVLANHATVDQTELAARFARRMTVARGYGAGAYDLLTRVRNGTPWQTASSAVFGGQGSFGNGAAMRVAPLGAFFAQAPDAELIRQATCSAEVTHAHPEGIAGAIAVAVATAYAWRERDAPLGIPWIKTVLAAVPRGYTHDAIAEALAVPPDSNPIAAAQSLGNGSGITAPETVPFCLWVAAHHSNFVEAMWTTVAALGDRDTTCAIVGGILSPRLGKASLPIAWLAARESFTLE
jgi:ADP-ribosylglycohydrolase